MINGPLLCGIYNWHDDETGDKGVGFGGGEDEPFNVRDMQL